MSKAIHKLVISLSIAAICGGSGARAFGDLDKFGRPEQMPTALTSAEADSTAAPSAGPSTAPASAAAGAQATKQADPIQMAARDMEIVSQRIRVLLPTQSLGDPKAREDMAPRVIPLLYYQHGLINIESRLKTQNASMMATIKNRILAELNLLEDPESVAQVQQMVASTDPSVQLSGQLIQLTSRWMGAYGHPTEAAAVADDVEKLDRVHHSDLRCATLTNIILYQAQSPDIKKQMAFLKDNVMDDPGTLGMRAVIAAHKQKVEQGQNSQNSMLNKPITLSGKTAEGTSVSTADMKGKVVLVDFWAVWCGPCVKGIPHIKDLYNKYHSQGLEVMGVDNDFDSNTMVKFTKENQMPWVQLFDPSVMQSHEYSALTKSCGVYGIPTAFLIDKQGVLRGVTVGPFTMDDLIPKLLAEGSGNVN